MAILGEDNKAAIANAKLKVFEDALLEDDLERESELPEFKVPKIKTEQRTSQSVILPHAWPPTHWRFISPRA